MKLLYDLLGLRGVSGDESNTSVFILEYIAKRKSTWEVTPEVFSGDIFHDCILLKFGSPKTAIFAHMDTVGFMARYENQLVAIGGPEIIPGAKLVGQDSMGPIICKLIGDEDGVFHDFPEESNREHDFHFLKMFVWMKNLFREHTWTTDWVFLQH